MRIAIFGGGSIGQRHAANARRLGVLTCVLDVDRSRGADPALFAVAWPDAVIIATPASTHETVAAQLLAQGYRGPLFVEKPLALHADAPVFRDWPHAVQMVGYNWRFHPEVQPIGQLASRGLSLHFQVRTDIRQWPGQSYGDPLLECSHEIDLAAAWLGDPTAIVAGPLRGGTWLQLQHPRGDSIIDIEWQASEPRRTISGHVGSAPPLVIDRGRYRTYLHLSIDVRPEAPGLVASYEAELRYFLDAVRIGSPTCIPFSAGLRVVEICERAKELATP